MSPWSEPEAEHLARMARSLQAWQRALGLAAAGGGVIEVDAFAASVVRAAPERSLLNAAVAPRGAPVTAAALDELGQRYAEARIAAWGAWVHEDDAAAASALAAAGLAIDSRPTAMAMALGTLALPPADGAVTAERTDDLRVLAEPLAAAYGFPAALLTDGLPALLDHAEGWLARIDGVPAAGAMVVRAGDDAGIFLVGTAPELRGRGAAGTLLLHALTAARARGCTTSTLQASAMGRPVYARLGYAELGRYVLWERRTPSSPA